MKINRNIHPLNIWRAIEGRVMPPLILWFFGVPGIVCIILWLFFFRGK